MHNQASHVIKDSTHHIHAPYIVEEVGGPEPGVGLRHTVLSADKVPGT